MERIFLLIKTIFLVLILICGIFYKDSAVQIVSKTLEQIKPKPKSAVQLTIEQKIGLAREEKDFPKKIVSVAESFYNTPYTITSLNDDSLIIRTDSFNCWTFVETTVAIVLSSTSNKIDYDLFKQITHKIRYRKGVKNGYVSRIHYFLEWKLNLEKSEVADDYSYYLNGQPIIKKLSYISSVAPDSLKKTLRTIEWNLSKEAFYYVPEDSIPNIEHKLLDGDIVGFVSDKENIDINHIAIIKKTDNKVLFIHATTTDNKVTLSHQTLFEYCKVKKNKIGIIVLRLYKSDL